MRYTLEISRKPESKGWTVVYEGNQSAFKVRRLTEATTYYFRVVATNVSGTGPLSTTLCVKTPYAPPPPVKGMSASIILLLCSYTCNFPFFRHENPQLLGLFLKMPLYDYGSP
ncbi:unnamed protein product [Dibothriocephalus latus]|uniref:Fibronectin type-III domain-containing protein n=1 Tax=Dibothriocephalus latus TaxID=60516 RepID=A0A3P7QX75_DIBLA|nr:unnamed protein product [Dibothriocephalus latus]